ncbi:MAG: VOC family protein [Thermoplasmata archaeon]
MSPPPPRERNSAPGVLGFDYVSLPVEDLEGAVTYYRDTLGLKLRFVTPGRWAEFDMGPMSLALYPREEDEPRGGEIAFAVRNLPEAVSRLEAKGVLFPHGIEEFQTPARRGRLVRFRDPFGNKLELVEGD